MSCQITNTERELEVKVDTKQLKEIGPPDGGWGWVVCFAVFMINFTVVGMLSANGVLLLGIVDLFNESISKTSVVSAIFSGATMFGGPLVLILSTCKASYRQIMMIGGIISAASAVASAFAPNIEILIFTYGISAGLSIATSYFSGNVILGCYFKRKRALALGIATSGSGCGGFLLSYLVERSISFYGMRGTFLLIGGLFLNLTVYGSLCRPLKLIIKSTHNISESRRSTDDKTEEDTITGFTPEDENTETLIENSLSIVNDVVNAYNHKAKSMGHLKILTITSQTASHRYSIEDIEMVSNKMKLRRVSVLSEKMPSYFANLRSRYCNATIFQNKTFCLLLVIYASWAVHDSLYIYLPVYAESVGLSREEGAMIMSIAGIVYTLSQLLVGFLADVVHIPLSYLLFVAMLGMSLSMVSIPFCQTFATLVSSTIGFSVGSSFPHALRVVLFAAVVGIEKVAEAYSIATVLTGVIYIVHPIVSGIIYDATISFPIIFYLDFAISFLGAILSFGVIYAQKKGIFA